MTIEHSDPPSHGGKASSLLRKKVAGVPVIYIAAGFVLIIVIYAWRTQSLPSGTSSDDASSDSASGQDDVTDTGDDATTYADAVPAVSTGTVVSTSSSLPATADNTSIDSNEEWLSRGVTFLGTHSVGAGEAQEALQVYLEGGSMTYRQGQLRDMVIAELGLPPDPPRIGITAPAPSVAPKPTPKPAPPPVKGSPAPKKPAPAPKPAPKTTYYVVRSGDNLSKIAAKYHTSWQKIYAVPANRKVIGSNPNLIRPGQRLIIP